MTLIFFSGGGTSGGVFRSTSIASVGSNSGARSCIASICNGESCFGGEVLENFTGNAWLMLSIMVSEIVCLFHFY